MSQRAKHSRQVLAGIICLIILSVEVFKVQVLAAGESVMVTAGEAAAESALTPMQAAENETAMETRLDGIESDILSGNSEGVSENGEEKRWEVITISTVEDLLDLAENCRLDTWSEYKYVRLEEDIRLINSDFTTIPIFNGIFDGNGHRITEYFYPGDGYVTGLFRYIGVDGIVKDLDVFANVTAQGDKQVTGGICGINYGVIRDCSFEGKLNGKTTTGGLAAINEVTGLISYCTNKGEISGYYYTGGIAGKNYGTISDSVNEGSLNNSVEWVNEEDEMSTGSKILDSIKSGNTEENPLVNTGTDTGGVAGYSRGSIIRCSNSGTVGYEHTGYNTGGIAGRQAGIIAMCNNSGRICGRKDIGGIVGQMEPYLEPDEVQSLSEAVDKLHDLVDLTIDNADGSVDVIDGDLENLTGYANGAVDTTNTMTDQFKRFTNSNIDTINTLSERFRHVTGQMPAIFDSLDLAAGSMASFNNDLKNIMKDIDIYGQLSANEAASVNEALRKISENTAKYNDAVKRMEQDADELARAISDNDIAAISECNARLAQDTADAVAASGEIAEQLNIIYSIMEPYMGDARASVSADIAKANRDMSNTIRNIKEAGRSTRGVFDYINSQSELKATKLGSDWDNSKDMLKSQLNGVFDAVNALSDHSKDTSHQTNADLAAVNDQLNVVFHILADDIDGLGNINKTAENIYTDVSDLVIEQITSGRTDNCENTGIIKGDINIGGICGSMDIDDNDPEQNAAGSADYNLGDKYLLRNVICDSVNKGEVESKKDGAGGIVGYMAQGIVTACEGYGIIESTEGGYVGGIAGQSLSIIRNSYVLANIGGESNVGGIAGYAKTLADNRCIPTWIKTGARSGSVAGQVERDKETQEAGLGSISGNYFLNNEISGIDGVSYKDIAEPLDHTSFMTSCVLPGEFDHMKVLYRIEDKDREDDSVVRLGEQELSYGQSLSDLNYPEPEAKEGYYVKWPDLTGQTMDGTRIVEGEYVEIVTVIESKETYPGTEKPMAYMDGSFEKETDIKVSILDEPKRSEDALTQIYYGVMDTIKPADKDKHGQVTYKVDISNVGSAAGEDNKLRLYNPFGDGAKIYLYDEGRLKKCDTLIRGSYAEIKADRLSAVYVLSSDEESAKKIALCASLIIPLLIILIIVIITVRIVKRKKAGKAGKAAKKSGKA